MTSSLPHNVPAEEAAVSILSQIPEAMTAFPWSERMFLAPHTRVIFNSLSELASNGVIPKRTSLMAALERRGKVDEAGGRDNVTAVLKTLPLGPGAGPSAADYFFATLSEAAARREILTTFAKREGGIRSGQVSPEQFIAELTESCSGALARKPETLKSQLASLVDEIENRTPPESFGVGLPAMDREMDGGIQRGELFTIAGPSGGGKSLLLAQAALNCARQGRSVAFFSLEMPAKAVLRRIVSNLSDCALPKIHQPLTEWQVKRFSSAIGAISQMPILIRDNLATLAEIETESRRLANLGKADVVIVDYIQRVQHAKADTREQAVAEVTTRLKALALRASVAVLTASQLNKQGDVRESSAIEHDSDILLKITEEGIVCQKFRRGEAQWVTPVERRGDLGRFNQLESLTNDDR